MTLDTLITPEKIVLEGRIFTLLDSKEISESPFVLSERPHTANDYS